MAGVESASFLNTRAPCGAGGGSGWGGVGEAGGSMDAANLLKLMLARGQVRCIGATTEDGYRKYAEKDATSLS